jgi:hypothetical protein
MGKDGDARFVTYLACSVASSQLWARHRSWLGGWTRCRARVSTGRSDIYRISDANATPTQAIQNTVSPVERYHLHRSRLTVRGTVLPRFACQTMDCDAIPPPKALRAANRRTDLDMPKNQNQKIKHGFLFLRSRTVDAGFLRKDDTVNNRGSFHRTPVIGVQNHLMRCDIFAHANIAHDLTR